MGGITKLRRAKIATSLAVRAGAAMLAVSVPFAAPAQEEAVRIDAERLVPTPGALLETYAGTVRASEISGLSYGARGCIVAVSDDAKRRRVAEAGQVLVELDDQRSILALTTAEARLQDMQAAVEERQLSIEAAIADRSRREQELEFVSREFQRNSAMFRRGLINETTMEAVERRMMDAKFAAERAQEALDSATSAKKRAEIAVEIGRLEQQSAEIDHEKLILSAPFDGVLVGFEANAGDCVQEGELAAEIYAPSQKAVDIFVLISNLSATRPTGVAIGEAVSVVRINGERCGGTITRIDTEADLEAQYVRTTIDVEGPCAEGLFLNEAVEVEAGKAGLDDLYTVPTGAIQGDNRVFLVDEETSRLVAVVAEIVMRGEWDSVVRLAGAEGRLIAVAVDGDTADGQLVALRR